MTEMQEALENGDYGDGDYGRFITGGDLWILAEAPDHIRELYDLIALLATDDPCTSSYEGLDDGCFFCDGWITYHGMDRTAEHEPNCPWVAARTLMGHDINPHTIKRPTPPPSVRAPRTHNPLIGY